MTVIRAHTGIPQSTAVNWIKLLGGMALVFGIIKAFGED
jgi:hypothetical protein